MTEAPIGRRLSAMCLCTVALAGCGLGQSLPEETDHSTILLVSLEDGSIIRQTVNLDADICVKSLIDTTTSCLTQGDPIVNADGVLVGYEMDPTTVELQASE